MIKAKDPRLRRISVAYEGFVVPQGVPLPRYSPLSEPLPVASRAEVAPSSPPPPIFQVEEEEEAEQEEEGFVDLTSATNDYEVFNQSTPSPNTLEDMGIQRKPPMQSPRTIGEPAWKGGGWEVCPTKTSSSPS